MNKIKSTSNNAMYMREFSQIEQYLKDNLKTGDILLTIVAGDVYKIGEEIVENL